MIDGLHPRKQARRLDWQCGFSSWGVLVVTFCLLGCDLGQYKQTKRAEVRGVVNFDGRPVENARIVFWPDGNRSGTELRMAYGLTDAQGEFELESVGLQSGLAEGRYRVLISKPTSQNALPLRQNGSQSRRDVAERISIFGKGELSARNAIPSHYNQTSDLFFDVISGKGVLTANFELSSKDPLLE